MNVSDHSFTSVRYDCTEQSVFPLVVVANSHWRKIFCRLSVGLSIPSFLALAHTHLCSKACAFRTTDEHLKKGESFPLIRSFSRLSRFATTTTTKQAPSSWLTMPDARITNLACFIAGAAACLFVTKSLNRKAGRNGAYESSDDLG